MASSTETDENTVQLIEEGYKKLKNNNFNSLLKKYFTENLKERLKYKKTKLGATLFDVIRSGVANPDSGIGVYAPDQESYRKFAELFNPIIDDYHEGFGPEAVHPPTDFGENNISEFKDLDPEGKYLISTRIRCARTLEEYPFNPLMSLNDYISIETKMKKIFKKLKKIKQLKGIYYSLNKLNKKTKNKLIKKHFLFKGTDF
ncbi:unnamed protein product [Meloidogyne enterolobii]|uniref:Uncharacterized protein n=1 Tax=Meloidogyne enterolobii TaxID=390850 RepID=A0ACB0Z5J3_MELEN